MDDWRKKLYKFKHIRIIRIISTVIWFSLAAFLLYKLYTPHFGFVQNLLFALFLLLTGALAYLKLLFFPARKIFKSIILYTEPFRSLIAMLFVFVPLVLYVFSSSSLTTIPPINFDIITVSGILSGFSLTAAVFHKVDRKMRRRLFVVAMVFALATALLVIAAVNLQLVNLLGGINLNETQFDNQGVNRWYTFWLSVIGFYGGTFSFSYAIIDLLFVIANLTGLKKQPVHKRKISTKSPK